MTNDTIPPPREPIADPSGIMSAPWYRYFSGVGPSGSLRKSGSTVTSARVLVKADVAGCVEVGPSGSITIPNGVFSNGDVVWLYNDNSASAAVTCSITLAYISGTNTDKASVTLATRGLVMIRFLSATECTMLGSVS